MEYFEDAKCIGFTRLGLKDSAEGNESKREGLAVVLNIGSRHAMKRMFLGETRRGQRLMDLLEFAWGEVVIDGEGWGEFPVGPRTMSVWLNIQAAGREKIDELTSIPDMYGKR